jgi:hypothetical protein
MNFLESAANMYKYSFAEQLLIHAQRPNATACAPIETWNATFKRWVQPGTKGIALIDDSGSRPKLKYVFDVNDTHTYGKDAPQVKLWELREEHKSLVLAELAKIYDDVDPDSIAQTFHNIARQMATEYYEDNTSEIRFRSEGSILESLGGTNPRNVFVDAVSVSMAYLMMKRCGFDTEEYFTEDDFNSISNFNTGDIIHSLGEVTSDLSQQVLRDVELVVKKFERQKANELALQAEKNIETERNVEHERDNTTIPNTAERNNSGDVRSGVHSNGGLSSAEHSIDGEPGRETAGQIRSNAESVLENPPQNNLRTDAVQGEPVPPLQGNGGISGNAANASGERDTGEGDPAEQGNRPDGLDGGDEHHQGASGRTGTPRTDLRRNLAENESSYQLGTKITGEPELPPITENLAQTLSTSSITADEVDSILRDGGNDWRNSLQRIVAHFAKDLPVQTNAAFLRDEYLRGRFKYHSAKGGGKGFQFGNDKTSAWWNEDGIKIGRGDSAIFARDFAIITWEQAAERIKQLYDAGHFVNHDVLEEALHNEYSEMADSLLCLYRDDFTVVDGIEMPENWEYKGTWPDTAERIVAFLKDTGEYGVSGEYKAMLTKLREDISELESYEGNYRQWHDPHLTLRELEKLSIDPVGFPVAKIQNLNAMRFITNDEIDSHLATVTYGTKRMNGYEILADTLNLKDARVYDYSRDADGRQTRELNKKETMLAQQKQEQIKQAFKEWIFKDPNRREILVKFYNEKFNSTRPRTFNGEHINFVGINPEEKLRPHQVNAIARVLYGGNTLLAHAVGAGKTWEVVASVMESKRLGLANKSLISVPNHLTEQWGSSFLQLYPSANILVATKKDFEMRNRRKFIAKIATGDYDAIIIGHTQLEKIPLSAERQQRILWEQIDEIEDGIREVEESKGDRFTIKQLAKTKKSLEARLSKLMSGKKRNDVIDYEQLEVDWLYIDESHFFKNLSYKGYFGERSTLKYTQLPCLRYIHGIFGRWNEEETTAKIFSNAYKPTTANTKKEGSGKNEQGVHSRGNIKNHLLQTSNRARNGNHDRTNESWRYDFQQVGIPSKRRHLVHNGLERQKRPRNNVPVCKHHLE